jgi:adenine/guanine phosphoribosyltransferase-like PRPP-binding protein
MTPNHTSAPVDPWAFEPTTTYWQDLLAADDPTVRHAPPYQRGYPAPLPDGRFLVLPLRGVPGDPDSCVASLIANQASFAVVEALAGFMADLARPYAVDAVVGLPTLGLAFAPRVAQLLGFTRFIPFGYSRKYWYQDALSVPVHSLTTPDKGKLLYVDPNLAGGLRGKRVLIVDDAVSSGQTMASSLQLLAQCGAEVVAISVAMRQGAVWKDRLRQASGEPIPVLAAFDSPRMRKVDGGWTPKHATPAA